MRSGKVVAILAGILYIMSAIYLMMNPAANMLGMSWLFAFSILMGGISEVVFYFKLPDVLRDGWKLASGIFTIIVGIYLLSGAFVTLPIILPIVVGVWLIVFNVTRIVRAFKIRQELKSLSNVLLWTGIIGLLIGILLLNHPLFGSLTVAYILAISFLYQGITLVFDAFKA